MEERKKKGKARRARGRGGKKREEIGEKHRERRHRQRQWGRVIWDRQKANYGGDQGELEEEEEEVRDEMIPLIIIYLMEQTEWSSRQ